MAPISRSGESDGVHGMPEDPWAEFLTPEDYAPFAHVLMVRELELHGEASGIVILEGRREGRLEQVRIPYDVLYEEAQRRVAADPEALGSPVQALARALVRTAVTYLLD